MTMWKYVSIIRFLFTEPTNYMHLSHIIYTNVCILYICSFIVDMHSLSKPRFRLHTRIKIEQLRRLHVIQYFTFHCITQDQWTVKA